MVSHSPLLFPSVLPTCMIEYHSVSCTAVVWLYSHVSAQAPLSLQIATSLRPFTESVIHFMYSRPGPCVCTDDADNINRNFQDN